MNEIRKKLEKKKEEKRTGEEEKKKQTKTFFRIEAQIPAVYACVCVCGGNQRKPCSTTI